MGDASGKKEVPFKAMLRELGFTGPEVKLDEIRSKFQKAVLRAVDLVIADAPILATSKKKKQQHEIRTTLLFTCVFPSCGLTQYITRRGCPAVPNCSANLHTRAMQVFLDTWISVQSTKYKDNPIMHNDQPYNYDALLVKYENLTPKALNRALRRKALSQSTQGLNVNGQSSSTANATHNDAGTTVPTATATSSTADQTSKRKLESDTADENTGNKRTKHATRSSSSSLVAMPDVNIPVEHKDITIYINKIQADGSMIPLTTAECPRSEVLTYSAVKGHVGRRPKVHQLVGTSLVLLHPDPNNCITLDDEEELKGAWSNDGVAKSNLTVAVCKKGDEGGKLKNLRRYLARNRAAA